MRSPVTAWVWGALALAWCCLAASTTNLLLLVVAWICLVVTRSLLGPHPGVGRATRGLTAAVVAVWIILALVSPPSVTTLPTVLWRLPSWSPGPGVSLGGAMTVGGLLTTISSLLRALVVVATVGVLASAVPAASGSAAARRLLGEWSPALDPFAALPETLDHYVVVGPLRLSEVLPATMMRARGLAPAHVPAPRWTAPVRSLLLTVIILGPAVPAITGHGLPGLDQPTTLAVSMLVATALVALLPVGEPVGRPTPTEILVALLALTVLVCQGIGVDGSSLTPSPGWPPVPVVTTVAVVLLPVLVALIGPGRIPRTHREVSR